MVPCTLSASFAFMLPVATPPNAIVFSYGYLKVADMAKTGFVMNIIGILCITLAINSWGKAMFDLSSFPSWANTTRVWVCFCRSARLGHSLPSQPTGARQRPLVWDSTERNGALPVFVCTSGCWLVIIDAVKGSVAIWTNMKRIMNDFYIVTLWPIWLWKYISNIVLEGYQTIQ